MKTFPKDTVSFLADYLAAKGYPVDGIATELLVDTRKIADVVTVDTVTKEPLALWYIGQKPADTELKKKMMEDLSYLDRMVPLYSVTFLRQKVALLSFEVVEEKITATAYDGFPTYEGLRTSVLSKLALEAQLKQHRTLDKLQILCWSLAFGLFIVFVVDVVTIFEVSTQQLGLLTIIIGLSLVPFASKLKLLGFEFERYQKKQEL